jgi:hypothetical protein
MSNKAPTVVGGGKRRTLHCQCGAVMVFYQKNDSDTWCRLHARKCEFMKLNFHKNEQM